MELLARTPATCIPYSVDFVCKLIWSWSLSSVQIPMRVSSVLSSCPYWSKIKQHLPGKLRSFTCLPWLFSNPSVSLVSVSSESWTVCIDTKFRGQHLHPQSVSKNRESRQTYAVCVVCTSCPAKFVDTGVQVFICQYWDLVSFNGPWNSHCVALSIYLKPNLIELFVCLFADLVSGIAYQSPGHCGQWDAEEDLRVHCAGQYLSPRYGLPLLLLYLLVKTTESATCEALQQWASDILG